MYIAKVGCMLCGHTFTLKDNELSRITMAINNLEEKTKTKPLYCDKCQEMGPIKVTIYREDTNSAVFGKIIYNDKFLDQPHKDKKEQPKLDTACFLCNAKGKLEVQYIAHKKDPLLGVKQMKCPLCEGKGYLAKS